MGRVHVEQGDMDAALETYRNATAAHAGQRPRLQR